MSLIIKNLHHLTGLLIKCTLLFVVLSVLVPWSPKMPAPTLDSSWAVGLNQAVVQGLAFGKEIIFTLGPYSFLYTKTYHPELDSLMLGGSLYLALSYWLCLLMLLKDVRGPWALVFGFFLFIMVYARDSLFFSYPLLVGLVCFKNLSPPKADKYFYAWEIALFIPFGLIALIKGSFLVLCSVISILCCVFFIIYKRKIAALITLIVPIISLMCFWVGIGQSITNLPLYLSTMFTLVTDFTEAMSVEGNSDEPFFYCLNMIFLLGIILAQKQISGIKKVFLLTMFLVFLFMSLKAGFARHYGHALIPATSIMLATLLLPLLFNSRLLIYLFCCSVSTWYFINSHYISLSIRTNFQSNLSSTWHGFSNRMLHRDSLKQDFLLTMDFLKKQADFPVQSGTTDIYSYNQSYLIASTAQWAPRPIFQSYSVFNRNLAEKNQQHLQGSTQPDNIIFKIEPIDERVPALEDGPSWPLLLTKYHPFDLKNDFLYLRKKNTHENSNILEHITTEKHRLGETVALPLANQPIYTEIEIKPTLLGHIATFLFKPSQLQIIFNLQNGSKKQYRIIANMAKAGFLMSPLIENTSEFTVLYLKKDYLNEKNVQSFLISTTANKNWLWSNEYIVHFKQFNYSS